MNAIALAVNLLLAPVSVQLPLSLSPPTPPAFTQAVSQTLVINGQSYAVSGTLTFTPTGTSAALPIQPGSVEFPKGSKLVFSEGHIPGWGWGPRGEWSMRLSDGNYPDPWAPPFFPRQHTPPPSVEGPQQ